MDIEDWYHLDYFHGMDCDRERSLLDGISVYREILSQEGIPSSFFVLGELVKRNRGLLSELVAEGHDVGAHGWDHLRPLKMSVDQFRDDLVKSKQVLEDAMGAPVEGYRAPCFSLDRARLDLVRETGFVFDSSYIPFTGHPLYGRIDMTGFSQSLGGAYHNDDFFEFEVSTLRLAGKDIPVSGGGYLRIFPWLLMGSLIRRYLKNHDLYTLYVHPFELSRQATAPLPRQVSRATRLRFNLGRPTTRNKLVRLIALLKSNGFEFTTFSRFRTMLMASTAVPLQK